MDAKGRRATVEIVSVWDQGNAEGLCLSFHLLFFLQTLLSFIPSLTLAPFYCPFLLKCLFSLTSSHFYFTPFSPCGYVRVSVSDIIRAAVRYLKYEVFKHWLRSGVISKNSYCQLSKRITNGPSCCYILMCISCIVRLSWDLKIAGATTSISWQILGWVQRYHKNALHVYLLSFPCWLYSLSARKHSWSTRAKRQRNNSRAVRDNEDPLSPVTSLPEVKRSTERKRFCHETASSQPGHKLCAWTAGFHFSSPQGANRTSSIFPECHPALLCRGEGWRIRQQGHA